MRNKSACWWWSAKITTSPFSSDSSEKDVEIKIGWAWKLINREKCRFCLCFSCLFFPPTIFFIYFHSHVHDDSHSQGSSDLLWIFINLFQLSIWNFSQIFFFILFIFYKRKEKKLTSQELHFILLLHSNLWIVKEFCSFIAEK